MYCFKCGKELPDGETFCAQCGSNQGGGAQPGFSAGVKSRIAQLPSITLQAKQKYLVYVLLGLLFLGLLFSLLPQFSVIALGVTIKSVNMFDDVGALTFITVLLYLGAAAVIIYSLLTKRVWRRLCLLAKIAPCWTLLWFIIFWIGFSSAIKKKGYSDFGSCGPNVVGWMLLLSSIATVILAFVLSAELKAILSKQNTQKNGE